MGKSEIDSGRPNGFPAVRLNVLGAFAVARDDGKVAPPTTISRKSRTLLKLLAVQHGRVLTVDQAVEVLWPDHTPASPGDNVATLVSRLRSWLGPRAIGGGRDDGYRLAPGVEIDLELAERLVRHAEQHLAQQHSGAALVPAEQAVALLERGIVLEDEPYATWAEPARRRQTDLRRAARVVHVRASLATGQPRQAAASATVVVTENPLDEELTRDLMIAWHDAGEPAKALAAYAILRRVLADELGTGPGPATESLHLALLRNEPLPHPIARTTPGRTPTSTALLVERDHELAILRSAWAAAVLGTPAAVLVTGEAGIGKTVLSEALATEVAESGGLVLRSRSYEAERSLFLQPLVEALTPTLAAMPAHQLRDTMGEHADSMAALVPAVRAALGPGSPRALPLEEERRRAFEAVLHLLRRLAVRAPVLVVLDDLHQAGRSTAEAVHYLARHAGDARLLVVATLRRDEGAEVLAVLRDVSSTIEPALLTTAGVAHLATAAGLGDRADDVAARTNGHPYFVAEVLRGLDAGESSVPDSLQTAVLARVTRVGAHAERVLRAAAVLSAEVDPSAVARVLGIDADAAASECERAETARLLIVSGRAYEFANDIVREVLYDTTPPPTRRLWHLRAADLAPGNHEATAHHAAAAGETARAATAWLFAAEQALTRVAVSDAEHLAGLATDTARAADLTHVLGRSLQVRAHALEVRQAYAEAMVDLQDAASVARDSGDQRLEMSVMRQLGGDVPVGLGLGSRSCDPYVDRGLVLARSLGDRRAEADLLGRRAVMMCNRLMLRDALAAGTDGLAAARAAGDPAALVAALDGQKTALAFLGDLRALEQVIAELEPELRRQGDLWRLQWCVFDSAYPEVAAGRWDAAESRVRAAIELNRRSGYLAYGGWFEAHLGWLFRLQGRLDEALGAGRQALATSDGRRHPWWRSTACLHLAATLHARGDLAGARDLLVEGLEAAEQDDSEAYILGCRALLADVTGDSDHLAAADSMLRRVDAPAGQVWMLGAGAYLAIGRAWVAAGDTARAAELFTEVASAARSQGWQPVLQIAEAQLERLPDVTATSSP